MKPAQRAYASRKRKTPEESALIGATLLPDEILLAIFQHIGPRDLLFGVALVCKRWRVLTQDPTLWRACDLTDEDLTGDLSLLALAPLLRGVTLLHTSHLPQRVVNALLRGHKDLRALELHFREQSLPVAQLKAVLWHFPNLQHLSVRLPAASHDGGPAFSAFHRSQKLKSLELHGFVSPVSELLDVVTERCRCLHTLHLTNTLMIFRDEHLTALVSDGRPWQSLSLMAYFISEAAYECFACLEHLQQLALVKCKKLNEQHLLRIASLPKLHTLTLSENCILSSRALSTCFQYQTMAGLLDINLTVYRTDDPVALAIATNCTKLKRLRLAMCLLSDDGVRSIILNASHLTHLDLEGNVIRGHWFHLITTHLPRLTRLNLNLCFNILMNLNDIVARLPTLSIIDPTGNEITCSYVG